jgi:hypothetical protein
VRRSVGYLILPSGRRSPPGGETAAFDGPAHIRPQRGLATNRRNEEAAAGDEGPAAAELGAREKTYRMPA